MDLAPDFDEFCALLIAHHVEFVVVGAYALAFHGAPRFTGDLAIFVRPTEANGERLLDAITAFGFPTAPVTPADLASGIKVLEMGLPPVQVHVMSDIDGVTWDESGRRTNAVTLATTSCRSLGVRRFSGTNAQPADPRTCRISTHCVSPKRRGRERRFSECVEHRHLHHRPDIVSVLALGIGANVEEHCRAFSGR